MSSPSAPSSLSIGDQVREKIATLQNALLAADPTMPTILRQIHTALRADPAIVTLLADEEIGTVVSGLSKQMNVVIATKQVKAKGASKNLKNTTLDML